MTAAQQATVDFIKAACDAERLAFEVLITPRDDREGAKVRIASGDSYGVTPGGMVVGPLEFSASAQWRGINRIVRAAKKLPGVRL